MKKLITLVFIVLFCCVMNAQVNLQDSTCSENESCSCADYPTPAGIMISHVHEKGEWMISYRYMSMSMNGLSKGSKEINQTDVLSSYAASPDLMKMNMHMLMAMYGVTERFTLMVMLNYASNYMEMTMPSGKNFHRHSMSTSGIGDSKFYVLYAPIKKTHTQLLTSLGVSLPTGNINNKGLQNSAMYAGTRYPYAMQLGSGTVDLLPSFSYLYQHSDFTYAAQVAGTIRTTNTSYSYKLGNEGVVNLWSSWQWSQIISSSLRAELSYSGKIRGKDSSLQLSEEPSASPANYGGTRAFIFIGSSLHGKKGFLKKNSLSFEYGIPFYQNLNGIQMPLKNSFVFSYSLSF